MTTRRYRIPSTSALQAFECAARHCNFSRAAAELHTSQSAISRHVSSLESRLNTSLFDRQNRKQLMLTFQGEQLQRAVVSGLDNIQAAIDSISGVSSDDQLTVACTHEISHLYLLPRFEALQEAIGRDRPIRIMTYEYDTMATALDPRIDVAIQYDVSRIDPADQVCLVDEAVKPVAAPALIDKNRALLEGDINGWQELPFLELSKHNFGWATWRDWLQSQGIESFEPDYIYFSNYVYLLEAAAAGKGLALGWRVLIERHLQNGSLLSVVDDYVSFDRGIYASLTAHGRGKPLARKFLNILEDERE